MWLGGRGGGGAGAAETVEEAPLSVMVKGKKGVWGRGGGGDFGH